MQQLQEGEQGSLMERLPVWGDEGAFGDRWWQSRQNDVTVLNAIELKKANFMFYRFYQNKNRPDGLWSSAPDSATRVLWHWQPLPGSPEAPPPLTLLSRSLRAPQARPKGAFPDFTLPRAAWLLHCLGPLWVSSQPVWLLRRQPWVQSWSTLSISNPAANTVGTL